MLLASPAAAQDIPVTVQEPVFSMERAAKLFFWAAMAYHFTEVRNTYSRNVGEETLRLLDARVDEPARALAAAKELLGVQQHRMFWERTAETKVLVAWGPRTLVVAFRGTAVRENERKDMQARAAPVWLACMCPVAAKMSSARLWRSCCFSACCSAPLDALIAHSRRPRADQPRAAYRHMVALRDEMEFNAETLAEFAEKYRASGANIHDQFLPPVRTFVWDSSSDHPSIFEMPQEVLGGAASVYKRIGDEMALGGRGPDRRPALLRAFEEESMRIREEMLPAFEDALTRLRKRMRKSGMTLE